MSTTDGDAASRLDDAIADVLHQRGSGRPDGATVPPPTTDDDWSVDDPDDDEPFELPEIVPATAHAPAPGSTAPVTPPPVARTTPSAPQPTATPRSAPPAARADATTSPATSWSDHMVPLHAPSPSAGLRAPGRRPRVRRVTRVVRHIDPWSTFKLALLFSVVAYLVALTSGVLLWRVADSTGTLDNVERWFTQFGWETFELKGGEIFHNAWIIGLFGAVALTGGLVLLATLYNLVSDIVGGIRVTVLEEEVVERTVSSTRRYVVRRPPTAADEADDWDVDDAEGTESGPPDAVAGTADAEWSIEDDDESADGDEPTAESDALAPGADRPTSG